MMLILTTYDDRRLSNVRHRSKLSAIRFIWDIPNLPHSHSCSGRRAVRHAHGNIAFASSEPIRVLECSFLTPPITHH